MSDAEPEPSLGEAFVAILRVFRRWGITPRVALAMFLVAQIIGMLLSFGPAGIR